MSVITSTPKIGLLNPIVRVLEEAATKVAQPFWVGLLVDGVEVTHRVPCYFIPEGSGNRSATEYVVNGNQLDFTEGKHKVFLNGIGAAISKNAALFSVGCFGSRGTNGPRDAEFSPVYFDVGVTVRVHPGDYLVSVDQFPKDIRW